MTIFNCGLSVRWAPYYRNSLDWTTSLELVLKCQVWLNQNPFWSSDKLHILLFKCLYKLSISWRRKLNRSGTICSLQKRREWLLSASRSPMWWLIDCLVISSSTESLGGITFSPLKSWTLKLLWFNQQAFSLFFKIISCRYPICYFRPQNLQELHLVYLL